MVNVLDLKLWRDLWRLRGQVLAVAMVIASGVATLVMAVSTRDALYETTQAYYERYRFGDLFAHVTRAPETLVARIRELPGVQRVDDRISRYATIDVADFPEPVIGQLTSIPERGQPRLNQLVLRTGRWVEADAPDEVIVNEPFAEAHALAPGDYLSVIMNSHKRRLKIVGTALSPEFIYALGPGALLPDDKRFGVLWMGREALEAAYDLDGAFNDISLTLLRGVAPETVVPRLDALLERFGGTSAIARDNQVSNWFVMNEIEQLKTMSVLLPTIFLAVAAFLTNMVFLRLIAVEREQIGLLKAFGYSKAAIAWHYTKMVLAIGVLGVVVGGLLGMVLGRHTTEMYTDELFRFPLLIYRPAPMIFVIGALVSLTAALVGALGAVLRAARLPPAEAMIPPAPPSYQQRWLGASALGRWLDQPSRIAFRQLGRRPLRSLFTATGIAMSVGLMVMALQWFDAIDHIAQVYFFNAQRQDLTIGLTEPEASNAIHEFERMPAVMAAEPMRIVPAEISRGKRLHRGAITAIEPDARLWPIYDDRRQRTLPVPEAGVVLASRLARKLDVSTGDRVWVKILEGRRPEGWMPVVDIFDTYIAMPAYMSLAALNRLLKERPSLEYANVQVDKNREQALFNHLKQLPTVSAVMLRKAAVDAFYDTMGEFLLFFVGVFSALAALLSFGIAYNSTRIALSERGRELATLRVLGFTRGEISYILLGEVALLIFFGLPVGCAVGWLLSWTMSNSFDTELFRVPLVIDASTYGIAVIITLSAAVLSAALVRRRVDRLDLMRVLKTRE